MSDLKKNCRNFNCNRKNYYMNQKLKFNCTEFIQKALIFGNHTKNKVIITPKYVFWSIFYLLPYHGPVWSLCCVYIITVTIRASLLTQHIGRILTKRTTSFFYNKC